MERAAIVAGSNFGVRFAGLFKRMIAAEGDDAVKLRVIAFDAVEINVDEAFGGELAGFDPAGKRW